MARAGTTVRSDTGTTIESRSFVSVKRGFPKELLSDIIDTSIKNTPRNPPEILIHIEMAVEKD